MSFRASLSEYLRNNDQLNEITGKRIYAIRPEREDAYPYAVFKVDATEFGHTMKDGDGVCKRQVSITCVDTDTVRLEQVTELLREMLQGFRGRVGDTEIRSTFMRGESDVYVDPPEGVDVGPAATILTIEMTHRQTRPETLL